MIFLHTAQRKDSDFPYRFDSSLKNNYAERNIRIITIEKMKTFPTTKAVGILA